jgi:hypothetical protein
MLTAYDLTKGETIYALIPDQYQPSTMYIDGVETTIMSAVSAHWVKGVFQGMPGATSGFYFETSRPVDGGLYLMAIETPVKYPATAFAIVRGA